MLKTNLVRSWWQVNAGESITLLLNKLLLKGHAWWQELSINMIQGQYNNMKVLLLQQTTMKTGTMYSALFKQWCWSLMSSVSLTDGNWRRRSITILCRILVCFFFSVHMSWIFECALWFNRKSQPCIFLRWFALRFPVKTYAKKPGGAFCSRQVKETFCFSEQWNQWSVP